MMTNERCPRPAPRERHRLMTPDYRETVEKLRNALADVAMAALPKQHSAYLMATMLPKTRDSIEQALTDALALLTAQADELATLRAAVVENYAAARAVAQGGTLTDPMEDRAARWRASDEALRTLAGVPPRRKQESKV